MNHNNAKIGRYFRRGCHFRKLPFDSLPPTTLSEGVGRSTFFSPLPKVFVGGLPWQSIRSTPTLPAPSIFDPKTELFSRPPREFIFPGMAVGPRYRLRSFSISRRSRSGNGLPIWGVPENAIERANRSNGGSRRDAFDGVDTLSVSGARAVSCLIICIMCR